MTFQDLVLSIKGVHEQCLVQATKAVNISLTLRNWMIGYQILEYEQGGLDRANYGSRVIEKLASTLHKEIDQCYTGRYLRLCRQLYEVYPQIGKSVISKSDTPQNWKSLISESSVKKLSLQPGYTFVPTEKLIQQLSFTHFIELFKCEDPLKRAFYEHECIRGNWSVRELKRQIVTLCFERSGLSKNKKKLAALVAQKAQTDNPEFTIRDPYVFEFLGLKPQEVMGESRLEDALLDRLQEFLLELGHGFCFEARQKRILLDDEHAFVDLVFYHRILKCHVLIELKADEFKHEHVGQLNTYVNWYRKNAMSPGDNPPVGILLCTSKNHAKIEYALAGMNNKLFVKKYQLELPKKEEIQKFLEAQM
jgi:predicted nuclease of restriction endonuclease-like (RecB) superfamily